MEKLILNEKKINDKNLQLSDGLKVEQQKCLLANAIYKPYDRSFFRKT